MGLCLSRSHTLCNRTVYREPLAETYIASLRRVHLDGLLRLPCPRLGGGCRSYT